MKKGVRSRRWPPIVYIHKTTCNLEKIENRHDVDVILTAPNKMARATASNKGLKPA